MATIYHDGDGPFAELLCYAAMERFKKDAAKHKYSKKVRMYPGQRLKNEEIHIYRANGTVMGKFKLLLYEYPDVSVQKSVSYRVENKKDSRYYDDSVDEILGGDKEVLG